MLGGVEAQCFDVSQKSRSAGRFALGQGDVVEVGTSSSANNAGGFFTLFWAAIASTCQKGKLMVFMTSSKRSSNSRFSSRRITWSAGNRSSRSALRPCSTRRWRAAVTTASSLVRASSHARTPGFVGVLRRSRASCPCAR